MIYIVTVHWVDPKWIEIQRRALEDCLLGDYRVMANLEGIGTSYYADFSFAEHAGGSHPDKLNRLAARVAAEADRDDVILFLDGDAFPIRPLDAWLSELLAHHPLAAVRRAENAGDLQPHPCFCVTTVGFWQDIGGDWRSSSWINERGGTTKDVGGRLLATLTERNIAWREILRSNKHDLHSLFYGIYEDHVYHHGAGFRPPVARVDDSAIPIEENQDYVMVREQARLKSVLQLRPRHVPTLLRAARQALHSRELNDHIRVTQEQSDAVYAHIRSDPDFYLMFEDDARRP